MHVLTQIGALNISRKLRNSPGETAIHLYWVFCCRLLSSFLKLSYIYLGKTRVSLAFRSVWFSMLSGMRGIADVVN